MVVKKSIGIIAVLVIFAKVANAGMGNFLYKRCCYKM
jgi:hypothetical protein